VRRALAGLAAALLTTLAATGVRADDTAARDEARALADRGYELFQEGRVDEALDHFRRAEARFHAPTLLLMIARAEARRGDAIGALITLRRVTAETLPADAPPEYAQAQRDAAAEAVAIGARVARLRVAVRAPAGAAVAVSLDGVAVPAAKLAEAIEVNPGRHEVEAAMPGAPPTRRVVDLAPGASEVVDIALQPAPPIVPAARPPEPSLLPPALAWAAGLAGVAVGATFGVLALEKQADLEDACPTRRCDAGDADLADDAERFASVSTVGFALGGAAIAAGVVLYLVRQDARPAMPAGLAASRRTPHGAALSGPALRWSF